MLLRGLCLAARGTHLSSGAIEYSVKVGVRWLMRSPFLWNRVVPSGIEAP